MSVLEVRAEALRWLRKRRLAAAYRDLFGTPEGELVLADILRTGGLLSTSHMPGDPYSTAFQEGRRAMALELISRLRWTDGELLQLSRRHEEAQAEQTAEED